MTEFQYFDKALELLELMKNKDIIEKYRNGNKSMIPFDMNFNLIH